MLSANNNVDKNSTIESTTNISTPTGYELDFADKSKLKGIINKIEKNLSVLDNDPRRILFSDCTLIEYKQAAKEFECNHYNIIFRDLVEYNHTRNEKYIMQYAFVAAMMNNCSFRGFNFFMMLNYINSDTNNLQDLFKNRNECNYGAKTSTINALTILLREKINVILKECVNGNLKHLELFIECEFFIKYYIDDFFTDKAEKKKDFPFCDLITNFLNTSPKLTPYKETEMIKIQRLIEALYIYIISNYKSIIRRKIYLWNVEINYGSMKKEFLKYKFKHKNIGNLFNKVQDTGCIQNKLLQIQCSSTEFDELKRVIERFYCQGKLNIFSRDLIQDECISNILIYLGLKVENGNFICPISHDVMVMPVGINGRYPLICQTSLILHWFSSLLKNTNHYFLYDFYHCLTYEKCDIRNFVINKKHYTETEKMFERFGSFKNMMDSYKKYKILQRNLGYFVFMVNYVFENCQFPERERNLIRYLLREILYDVQ